MKLKALIIAAAAAALTAATSMTAFATRYQDWYYALNGYYPSDNEADWVNDWEYYVYLDSVTTDTGADTSTTYYVYDYDTSSNTSYYAYTEDAYWNGSTAKWSVQGKASKYQVKLYRDSSLVTTRNCTSKSLNLSSYITKAGNYYFQVRAYNSYGGWSSWEESEDKYFSGSSSSSSSSSVSASGAINSAPVVSSSSAGPSATVNQTQSQWIKATDGTGRWWYRHFDGSYSKNAWESINGKWYYFDASGWMKTGWLTLNGATYYLNSEGAMVTGNVTIDGVNHSFDASGKMLS